MANSSLGLLADLLTGVRSLRLGSTQFILQSIRSPYNEGAATSREARVPPGV